MAKKASTKKSAARASTASVSVVAGVAGIVLAAWFIYGTVTIDPFRWGRFVEELIVAVCVLLALRLLCIVRLPDWLSIVCAVLLPAGIALYGLFVAKNDALALGRWICLAVGSAFALLTARELDAKPDGTLLAALLLAACLPGLIASETSFSDELMRALVMAGVFLSVLAVRQTSNSLLYLAALGFALGGAVNLFAAFAGAGAGIGAVLLAPKRKRGAWILPAVLMAALPVAAWLATKLAFPLPESLITLNAYAPSAFAQTLGAHLLRALDLGMLLLSIRWLFHREDAALPVLFAVAGAALFYFIPAVNHPDIWMQALPLSVLAGVGAAKVARGNGR
ncbi:MAG: hypothetical protein LLF75_13155 [Eubacteriales bacterium]|nr:hypothetical protein [Eubacteriales bacterium]